MAAKIRFCGVVRLGWHGKVAWMLCWPMGAALEPQLMAQLEVRFICVTCFWGKNGNKKHTVYQCLDDLGPKQCCAIGLPPPPALDAVAACGCCSGAATHGTTGGALYFIIFDL
jgi:hypothetical protein